MHEQHVDVTCVVQLGATELAHPDDAHSDARFSERERNFETCGGEVGELARDFSQVSDAEEVACSDTRDMPSLPPSQLGRRIIPCDQRARVAERAPALQRVGAQHLDRAAIPFESGEQRARRD